MQDADRAFWRQWMTGLVRVHAPEPLPSVLRDLIVSFVGFGFAARTRCEPLQLASRHEPYDAERPYSPWAADCRMYGDF